MIRWIRSFWVACLVTWLACGDGTSRTDRDTPSDLPGQDVPVNPMDLPADPDAVSDSLPGDHPEDRPEIVEEDAAVPETSIDPSGPGDSSEDALSGDESTGIDPASDPVGDAPAPIDDCKAFVRCLEDCCGDRSPCPEDCGAPCWERASPQAQTDWTAYIDCVNEHCSACDENPRPPACEECERVVRPSDCREQTLRCWEFGDRTCAWVATCILGCTERPACLDCFGSISLDAQVWLDSLGACLAAQCPPDQPDGPDLPLNPCQVAALEGACASQYAQCMAH